ncbi:MULTISPECIES: gamma-glutamylcyclotransferase family protein [unclassified Polynucleobacter]|uniref:gamma-glutamylcyclotransferase family protein n=1 Tax=unclassified Polynucleobacter TaxID=2640945 RepID=UPI002572EFF8|nr:MULTISPECIES: gamma-glutamylcyclotransferase family protein [unclassified Polynucleobacter]BEI42638.1 gamma-glutamylcyclotransferase [Polynucleobacter sp. HIN10]BEI44392.1 gamma-glutamylcyclotransferase [Polynucleobacter sp. HIN11]
MMRSDLLFVYGTLMSPFSHPNAMQFHAGAEYLGAAQMPGLLYRISWYPGATDRPSESIQFAESWVYGELWRLNNMQLLDVVDRYEECSPDDPSPHEYQRVLRSIHLIGTSEWQIAWVYLYQLDPRGLESIKGGRFRA